MDHKRIKIRSTTSQNKLEMTTVVPTSKSGQSMRYTTPHSIERPHAQCAARHKKEKKAPLKVVWYFRSFHICSGTLWTPRKQRSCANTWKERRPCWDQRSGMKMWCWHTLWMQASGKHYTFNTVVSGQSQGTLDGVQEPMDSIHLVAWAAHIAPDPCLYGYIIQPHPWLCMKVDPNFSSIYILYLLSPILFIYKLIT
jgi:hypothetical protein